MFGTFNKLRTKKRFCSNMLLQIFQQLRQQNG